MNKEEDMRYMKEALRLARSMEGRTGPDPMVGAVVVKYGKIIGSGFHAEPGTPHAEAMAIKKAGEKARGATLYLNLEPCCHFGNNPPCTEIIIKAGISRVVAAMKDPNPLVSGRGARRLKSSGIKVEIGLLRHEAQKLNEPFTKFITTGRPFFILKAAMTLDGKIASSSRDSKWISSPASRKLVHRLRNSVDAVMVGKNTVLADDPILNVRGIKPRSKYPLKIIIDPKAEVPLKAKAVRINPDRTVLVVSALAPKSRLGQFKKKGVHVIPARISRGRIDLKWLAEELGKMGVASVLIEGGGTLNASALFSGIVDKIWFFIAPKILGGKDALTPVEGDGIARVGRALNVSLVSVKKIGQDFLFEGYPVK